jgi:NAD(P)-dependent dehydrogenase (short-subunit alcohol dehydrogenase family)
MKSKIALVTGANRGMGHAASKKLASLNYHVIMVGRNEQDLNEKVQNLKSIDLSVEAYVADILSDKDTDKLVNYVSEKFGYLDVLINNAGIYIEESIDSTNFERSDDVMRKTFDINTMGPYRLMRGLIPLMLKHGYGRVVNVSSGLGSFNGASTSCPAYCVSKAALNMLTNLFGSQVTGTNVKVNAINPGWVKTDMGGAGATRSIEQGIMGMIWAATLDEDGPNGGFFLDGKPINW